MLKDRLILALSRDPELTQAGLARHCGLASASVSNWLTGKTTSLKGRSAVLAAQFLRCDPTWLATGVGSPNWQSETVNPGGAGDGQSLDVRTVTMTASPTLAWEVLMTRDPLPRTFMLQLRDGALSPHYNAGDVIELETGLTPEPGDYVLIRLESGCYMRRLAETAPGAWEARPVNPAYSTIAGSACEILAVQVGQVLKRRGSQQP